MALDKQLFAKGGSGFKFDKKLKKVRVGLAWDPGQYGKKFDADVSAAVLRVAGGPPDNPTYKLIEEGGFTYLVFYADAQQKAPNGSIVHSGDNRTGAGEGDDETITIDLLKLPADTALVRIVASIHEARQRGQNWGVLRPKLTLYNDETDEVLGEYTLSAGEAGDAIGLEFAALYKDENGDWRFVIHGVGSSMTLEEMAEAWG